MPVLHKLWNFSCFTVHAVDGWWLMHVSLHGPFLSSTCGIQARVTRRAPWSAKIVLLSFMIYLEKNPERLWGLHEAYVWYLGNYYWHESLNILNNLDLIGGFGTVCVTLLFFLYFTGLTTISSFHLNTQRYQDLWVPSNELWGSTLHQHFPGDMAIFRMAFSENWVPLNPHGLMVYHYMFPIIEQQLLGYPLFSDRPKKRSDLSPFLTLCSFLLLLKHIPAPRLPWQDALGVHLKMGYTPRWYFKMFSREQIIIQWIWGFTMVYYFLTNPDLLQYRSTGQAKQRCPPPKKKLLSSSLYPHLSSSQGRRWPWSAFAIPWC